MRVPRPIRRSLLTVTATLLAGGCREEEPPFVFPMPIDTATAVVRSGGTEARLLVEVARTIEQKRLGLGLRGSLDPGSGMIFPYDSVQPDSAGFWMVRMRVPLDIAFLDSAGTVVKIFAGLEPCTEVYREGCPAYAPGAPWWSVLETNQGWFAANGFGVGAVVTLEERAAR